MKKPAILPFLMNFSLKTERAAPNAKFFISAILVLIILSYGLFEAFDLLRGPSLVVFSPKNGQTLRDSLVSIEGQVKRIAKIYISGRQIFAQADGRFEEPLILGSGYNIIEVKVEDQFGRTINKKVEVVLQ